MAIVTFKPGEVQQLHGTFDNMVYRFINGKQHVRKLSDPVLTNNPTKEQQDKYDKAVMVQNCVAQIQRFKLYQGFQTVERMQLIADEYPAIKKAVERMYDDFRKYFTGSRSKLHGAIIYWYTCKKLPPQLELFRDELPDEYKV